MMALLAVPGPGYGMPLSAPGGKVHKMLLRRLRIGVTLGVLVLGAGIPATASDLPPPIGVEEPAAAPIKGEDGIYHQPWFNTASFLDLREDFEEARKAGKRFAVIFEQRGCVYCVKMHTEVLSKRYINDYVRENFTILQFDMWGAREVTDFDGTAMPEKKLAERWGVMFTPTIVFFKDDLSGLDGKWGQPLEVTRMNLGIGAGTFYDMFVWIDHKIYEQDRNFQRFHLARYNEREALAEAKKKDAASRPSN
ncbi:Cytochrome c biogenesis protein, transmembrane region (modular protein) [Candidatus Filomicrobium marinum]|uniref:Cytochrome c biogenesis protein, transmembrane region (Modular protein) n=2 Tax=Hyphomicrobiaceae TaxID=45401 RepID=A0A0D6JIY2_9HYPH|nr:thioredoxin family protein [Candidatus Filomicrobium marinum]CFX33572.1 Cytochrome c biogenesis protein, transmembrane region (modular protein) [Candidatus Filomicrobium marinum]CPR21908.1 Cytochrome c biogenesis protein, transmembrane region (modular protein) [Candidatus Filomicrobium marinum]